MSPLRMGIAGASHWHATMHVPAFRQAGAEIAAVTDSDPSPRAALAAETGAKEVDDLEAMLAEDLDLVLVMGRPAEVLPAAHRVVEAGVPLVVEKPIGIRGSDAAGLADAAATRDAFVSVPLVNRHSELWNVLEVRGAGSRRMHAHFRVVNGIPSRYRTMGVPWMLDPSESGGGALRNLGIHAVDAFLQFAGGESVEATYAALRMSTDDPGIEVYAMAVLQSSSGLIGTIEAGYTLAATAGSDTEWRVATRDLYLVDRYDTLREVVLADGSDVVRTIPSVRDRYDAFAADVLMRVSSGAPPLVSIADYVRAATLIDHIYDTTEAKEIRT